MAGLCFFFIESAIALQQADPTTIASDFLNKDMLIGLAIINPIYFVCLMLGGMKTMQISLSVILGAVLGPAFYFFSPEWSILFGGFFAGTIAFFIGEKK